MADKKQQSFTHKNSLNLEKASIEHLFNALDVSGQGHILKQDVIHALELRGILREDPRVKETFENLKAIKDKEPISFEVFQRLILSNISMVERALKGDLVIPDFKAFSQKINHVFKGVKKIKSGKVADYIPQLARIDPDYFALSVCTVDGQQFHLGDVDVAYTVQSTTKPINYAMALEECGEEIVHSHIGREPSGHGFNELKLNNEGLPHNPMINAGAIMSCSLIRPDLNASDRFDYVLELWKKLSGGKDIGFNNSIYLSEKKTADRNFALAYFMHEHKSFPEKTNILEVLDFYFQVCSIQLNCKAHSVVAGSLANAGICPLTRERVLSPMTTKNVLSLMYSCGMYDFSGEFAFSIGIPAKSGVSGSLLVVVPGVCGITIWAPALDKFGNSVKAVEVCKQLVSMFNFHHYDHLIPNLDKIDPRRHKNEDKINGIMALNYAASQGRLNDIKNLKAKGVPLNGQDYDWRSPMHLAASGGQVHIIQYFIKEKLNLNVKDRWGRTPLDGARKNAHQDIVNLLKETPQYKGEKS